MSEPKHPAGTARTSATTWLATGALLCVTAAWGSTFFLIKDLLDRVPTLDFLAVRFAIAAVVLRQHIGPVVWAAVVLATIGFGILSLRGLSVGLGESITLMSALLYAGHIVAVAAWSRARDAYGLAVLQMAVIAVICFGATGWDGLVVPSRADDWLSLVYMALVAGAAAMLAQTWAQAHLPAARAAIVMAMEPVFAATFAIALGGELLTLRILLGGAMVLSAMLLAELAPRRRIEGEVAHLGQ